MSVNWPSVPHGHYRPHESPSHFNHKHLLSRFTEAFPSKPPSFALPYAVQTATSKEKALTLHRQPLSPLKVPPSNLKVVKHNEPASNAEVARICQLMEKHDEQLELIARQIERLLDLKEKEEKRQVKPKMCSVETMTSFVLETPCSSPHNRASRKSVLTKTVKETTMCLEHHSDQSIERGRCADESEETFYQHMLSNIDGILLRHSESERSYSTIESPAKKQTIPKSTRLPDSHHYQRISENDVGAETIYIKQLASKYMSDQTLAVKSTNCHPKHLNHQPFHPVRESRRRKYDNSSRSPVRTTSTSIATKKYLEKYGLANDIPHSQPQILERRDRDDFPSSRNPKNKLLDLQRIKQQPKFK